MDPLFILMLLAVVAVVIILMIGIGGFAKGGAFNKKYGNKMMRLRLIAQFARNGPLAPAHELLEHRPARDALIAFLQMHGLVAN